MRVSKVVIVGTLFSTVISGCGGGGSSSSPPTSYPGGGSSATQPPPVALVQPASLQVATSANYVAGSSEDIAFKKLNAFRASQGLGPVNQDVRIDAAARSHAAYVTMNQSGADPHNEVVGKPGFTGVTVQDRLKAAGYASTRSSEVIAFSLQSSNPDTSAVDNLINSVYHRSAMMIQGLTHVGISGENANSPLYANFGAIKLQNNAGDFVSFYPTNQQTGVWLTHSLESPNPFYQEMDMTQANMCLKTSSPISVVSETSTALTVTSFTVTEDGQAMPLAARLITKSTSTQDTIYLPANEAYLIGKAPFKPNTKYNVRFIGNATGPATGTTNGLIVDKSWSFTTGSYTRSC